jgi:WD40-like Beta Propeller Repeat
MHCVIRRTVVAGGALAVVLLAATMASAFVPAGPRIAFFRLREKPEALELITTGPRGEEEQVLAGGGRKAHPLPYIFDTPAWSPDGTSIAFAGWPRKPPSDGSLETRIFIVGADGSDLRQVPGTTNGFSPVFSPNGGSLVYARVLLLAGRRRPCPHPSERCPRTGSRRPSARRLRLNGPHPERGRCRLLAFRWRDRLPAHPQAGASSSSTER